MIFNTKLACIGAVGIAALMFTACETSAQFYKGKKLDMYSAGGSKGSYNRHLRLMEKFLTKHIPGKNLGIHE